MTDRLLSRRALLAGGVAAGAAIVVGAVRLRAAGYCNHVAMAALVDPPAHPTPRPGIDASRVLKDDQLKGSPNAIPAFDEVRQIPQIVDGIRCHCGCATLKGYYSLLSCYEGDAMAKDCHICQGQGRMAFRLHAAGKSLDEIRAAVDAKYG
jgi:hypothetical protein